MTDKPDSAKDAGRTDSPGPKRPHATLDLKATEVKPPAQSPPESISGPAAAAASASSASSSSTAKPESKGPDPKAAAQAAAKTSMPETGAKTAAKEPPAATLPPTDTPKASRGGGFFSHLAAGVIGGGLVYAGVALLGPGGLPTSAGGDTSEFKTRLAALEQKPSDSGDLSAVTAKLGDAEGRLAKLEQLDLTLREAQDKIAADTKALIDAAQKDGANPERLAKLEEQLAMIAAATPGPDGRVPQLAAITGKISDLEAALNTQITQLRNSLPSQVEERLAAAAEASEAAKSGTQRLDRELAAIRTDQARTAQRFDNTKADTDRIAATVEAVREQSGKLASAVSELRAALDSQVKSLAKPEDISAAVGPVAGKLAALEQNLDSVVKSEQDRKENAERIVLSLELSNLKRALDRGTGYAAELAEVRKASGGKLDLAPLERYKDTGVATLADLEAEFRPVMNAVIDADTEPADGSIIDRLWAGAKTVVRVRKISADSSDTSAEAVIARMEASLKEGRLGDVIEQAKALPQRASGPIQDWLQKANARHSVDVAIAGIEDQLKASLAGTPEAEQPAPAKPSN